MSAKFNVKMTEKYMHDFMVYHNYTHFSGIMGVVVGIISAGLTISNFISGDTQTAGITMIVALLFLVVTPSTTKKRAQMQVKNSPMFKEALEYEFDEEGIVIRQGEAEAKTHWEECVKVVSTKKSVIIYITTVRALILPKECMGDCYEEAVKMIRTHIPAKRIKRGL